MTDADRRLEAFAAQAGHDASPAARPAGRYASFARAGELLHSSGVVGRENGVVIAGPIDDSDAGIALGERAAVAAAIALLRAARTELGDLDRVQKIVALTGYLQAGPGFTQHVRVMNAASELLRLGAEAEVIAPDELRGKMAELIGAMAARYADAPLRRVAGRKG